LVRRYRSVLLFGVGSIATPLPLAINTSSPDEDMMLEGLEGIGSALNLVLSVCKFLGLFVCPVLDPFAVTNLSSKTELTES
jgi:hypothetical protein